MLVKEMMRLKDQTGKAGQGLPVPRIPEPGRTYLISLITADGITVPQS